MSQRSHTPAERGLAAILLAFVVIATLALLVAALVARTTATVPGGDDGGTGEDMLFALDACQARGPLPDQDCTPGATDPRITQANIRQTICVSGYTAKVRPPTSYTDPLKERQMARYSVTEKNELDHLIPLALGGAPRNVLNLWPQVEEPRPGYHEKDRVERMLQLKVCGGQMMLDDAQHGVAADWTQYLQQARGMAMADDFDDDGEP